MSRRRRRGDGLLKELDGKKQTLQLGLIQAVVTDSEKAMEKAIKLLKEFPSPPAPEVTGPRLLDFTCKKTNDLLKNDEDKVSLEGEYEKFLSYSPLMAAVELGNKDRVGTLIEKGASVAFGNKNGLTALHLACCNGQLEIVKLLLEKSEEQQRFHRKKEDESANDQQVAINASFKSNGWTPLMYAVKNGHVKIVKYLMGHEHLNCWAKNKKKQNAYHIAIREGQLSCFQQLCDVATEKRPSLIEALKTSGKNNWNILHQVCTQDKISVKWLLEKFEELKIEELLNQPSKAGYTPFLVACEYHRNNGDTVNYFIDTLLKEGLVDISVMCHQEGDLGTSALHLAAIHNNKELVELLVKANCSLTTQDRKKDSILHVAMQRGNRSVANYIIETCKLKKIDLEKIANKNGKLPKDVEEFIIIPPEILRLGEKAIAAYEKALAEGRKKIPYCGLLILGESRVGKTSLYRQFVGKKHRKDLESTEGIDNNTVDALVDERNIVDWQENNISGNAFAKAAGEKTRELMPPKSESEDSLPIQKDLLQSIKQIEQYLKSHLASRIYKSILAYDGTSKLHQPEIPLHAYPELSPFVPHPDQTPEKHPQETKQVPPVHQERRSSTPVEVKRKEPEPVTPIPEQRHQQLEETEQSKSPTPERSMEVTEEPEQMPEKEPSNDNDTHDETPSSQGKDGVGISHQDGSIIAGIVKRGEKMKSEEKLTLVTLDFAGQPEYHSMHHCFISRRACYLVVFKLPDMVKHIQEGATDGHNSWEEFCYWIHSIHAHIYPPSEEEKKKMNQFRRIILVGTHRDDVKPEDLEKVDGFLKNKIEHDKRCVNHVITMKEKLGDNFATNYYIPVENSIDFKNTEDYRSESGTKSVQYIIDQMPEMLPFLQEEYPIKWLKFKERIEVRASSTPVLTVQEMIDEANRSRIYDEEQQKNAIKFLHDSGKIICLDHLSNLFLTKEEKEELSDKVIIRPQWLISIMKEVMKLKKDGNHEGIDKRLVVNLCDTGKANMELLQMCWEKHLTDTNAVTIRHLCLLLQAHCLIFPLSKTGNGTCSVSESDSTASSATECESTIESSGCSLYLIPSKLPGKASKSKIPEDSWFTFYFDFGGFLPAEIYHKLLCKLLVKSQSQDCNRFSQNECMMCIEDGMWRVQYKNFDHRLEISVAGVDDDLLKGRLLMLHELLTEICHHSHFKGLNYNGGILKSVCSCGKKLSLHYVKLKDCQKSIINEDKIKCSKCWKKIHDDQKQFTQGTTNKSVSSKDSTELNCNNVFAMLCSASASWFDIGMMLDVDFNTLATFKKDSDSVSEKLVAVINHWLCNSKNKSWTVLANVMGSDAVQREDIKRKIIEFKCKR